MLRHILRIDHIAAALLVTMICAATALYAAPAATPQIDREASEALFLKAYDHFIHGRMWSCIEELDRALEKNIYFVDAYYMRGLAYRRLGRYPKALSEMSYYMEVRQDDPRASTIFDSMTEEWAIISAAAKPDDGRAEYYYTAHTSRALFGLSVTTRLALRGMQGIGKIASSGSELFVCDMYGDAVYIFDREIKGEPLTAELPRPASCAAASPGELVIFGKSGDIHEISYSFSAGTLSADLIGSVDVNISDAVFIDSTLIAVADRTGQAVKFFSYPSLEMTAEWAPDDVDRTTKLFEPVALDSYGPFIAVADRANRRVLVIDSYTLAERARMDADAPRDLQWGPEGELYVLSDSGRLVSRAILAPRTDEKLAAEGLQDAWSIALCESGPILCDITCRTWWVAQMNPGHRSTIGAMSMMAPWLEERLDSEALMVRATASSIFQSFIQGKMPELQAIWRGEQRPARVIEIQTPSSISVRSYSPVLVRGMSTVKASSLKDVMADIESVSRSGQSLPKVLVLDTRIPIEESDQAELLAFLMQQGIRLDLWATVRPPTALAQRLSTITLGQIYYGDIVTAIPPNRNCEWILTIPLPPDTYTFGYPSESTLSIYADIDVIRFIDWLPVWPSLLKKR